MEIREVDLGARYGLLSSERLLELRGQGTLTPLAQRVINEILDQRGVPMADRQRVIAAVQQQTHEKQLKRSRRTRLEEKVIDIAVPVLFYVIMIALVFIFYEPRSRHF